MKIAVIGPMCSGKTTICNILIKINHLFIIKSFASKVKEIAIDLFDMKIKNRELLQQIGTNMRMIDKNIWVKYVLKECENDNYILIDDLRYENEYELLKKNDFKIIKLEISEKLQKERLKNTYKNNYNNHIENINHESEIFSKKINNNDVDLLINIDKEKNIEDKIKMFYLSLLV